MGLGGVKWQNSYDCLGVGDTGDQLEAQHFRIDEHGVHALLVDIFDQITQPGN